MVSDFQFGLFRCRCSGGPWDYGRASRANEGDSEEDQEELPQRKIEKKGLALCRKSAFLVVSSKELSVQVLKEIK